MKSFKSSLAMHIQDFLNLKESLGFSKNTYAYYLWEIDSFLFKQYPKAITLNEEFVMEWIKLRNTESINTQKRRMCTIRAFGKYLNFIGLDAFVLPSQYIGCYKKNSPYLFSDQELTQFFLTIDHIKPYYESPGREYVLPVLFRMIYCCGLRPSEPLLLHQGDVDLDSGSLFIKNSKAHKDRSIRMSKDLLELCIKFDKQMGKRTWFFPYLGRDECCNTHWLINQFNICWRKSGLDHGQKKPVPYSLRHNFATRVILKWIEEDLPFETMAPFLREYMGHSDISSTFYYIHLLPENIIRNTGIDWIRLSNIYQEVINENN
jgi:integrase